MKASKRNKLNKKRAKHQTASYKTGAGESKYAKKHNAQKAGYFSETSPLRFGRDDIISS